MSDLVTWLRAQLDWAETDAAEDHTLGCKIHDRCVDPEVDPDLADPNGCDCPVRGRLLDVAAKRAILDDFDVTNERTIHRDAWYMLSLAVKHLATAYADREGYDEAWRP